MKIYRTIAYFLILLSFTTIIAQSAACGAMVQQALAAVETNCDATARNQACYGYVSLQAAPRDGVQNFTFSKAGDLANVADIASLTLSHLDAAKNIWGIALMKLQANLPDALPGQNVTFLFFGDVKIQSDPQAPASYTPMQAFYFQSGITKTNCEQAPEDGILIQTPKGAGQITLRANAVDIQLGSTAFFQAQPSGNMTVSVVEGEGHISANGKTVAVPAGTQTTVPMDANLNASGVPTDAQPYDPALVQALPVQLLPDVIAIAPPATEEATAEATAGASSGGVYGVLFQGRSNVGQVCALDQPFAVTLIKTAQFTVTLNFTPTDATQGTWTYQYTISGSGESHNASGKYTISAPAADGSRQLSISGTDTYKFKGGGGTQPIQQQLQLTPESTCTG